MAIGVQVVSCFACYLNFYVYFYPAIQKKNPRSAPEILLNMGLLTQILSSNSHSQINHFLIVQKQVPLIKLYPLF